MYHMYNPTLVKIEVLRLEKRLDDELYYLRDAPHEYSMVSFDMEPEIVPEGSPVPINKTSKFCCFYLMLNSSVAKVPTIKFKK